MKTLQDVPVQHEIRSRLESLTADDTARWGMMSVHQMICHLRDSYGVALGEKKVAMVATRVPRSVMKRLALHAPMEWRHGFKSAPEVALVTMGLPACRSSSAPVWTIAVKSA